MEIKKKKKRTLKTLLMVALKSQLPSILRCMVLFRSVATFLSLWSWSRICSRGHRKRGRFNWFGDWWSVERASRSCYRESHMVSWGPCMTSLRLSTVKFEVNNFWIMRLMMVIFVFKWGNYFNRSPSNTHFSTFLLFRWICHRPCFHRYSRNLASNVVLMVLRLPGRDNPVVVSVDEYRDFPSRIWFSSFIFCVQCSSLVLAELKEVLEKLNRKPSHIRQRVLETKDPSGDEKETSQWHSKVWSNEITKMKKVYGASELGRFSVTGPTVAPTKASYFSCRFYRKDVSILNHGHLEVLRHFERARHFARDQRLRLETPGWRVLVCDENLMSKDAAERQEGKTENFCGLWFDGLNLILCAVWSSSNLGSGPSCELGRKIRSVALPCPSQTVSPAIPRVISLRCGQWWLPWVVQRRLLLFLVRHICW